MDYLFYIQGWSLREMLAFSVGQLPDSSQTTPTNQSYSHASFSSGIMLLAGICQNLLRQPDIEAILIDLLSAEDNCKMLVQVSESSFAVLLFFRFLSRYTCGQRTL
jgi:hypothetical protein